MRTDAEICQEARFVLWALRCALAAGRGDPAAGAELARGFALADVSETAPAFGVLAHALGEIDWAPTAWHHPRCGCVSSEEMRVLMALAETADRQRRGLVACGHWWSLVLPAVEERRVEQAARQWLLALERAGVVFPTPAEVTGCLQPLEMLAAAAGSARLH